MTTIYVKPAPGLDPAAAKVLKSDNGVGLLDAMGNVPDTGMPWPNGGLTFALLRDGVILHADDPVFAAEAAKAKADAQAKADADAATTQAKAPETTTAPAEAEATPSATEAPPAH